MAGMKTWVVGEEVLAADFNAFVQTQVVAQFANAAARTSGWPAPPQGALSYLRDTDTVWGYNGSTWVYVGGGTNPYAARLATAGGISIPNGILLPIPWDVASYGPAGMAVTGAAAGLVAPVAGIYLLTLNVIWPYNGAAALIRVGIQIDGVTAGETNGYWPSAGAIGTGLTFSHTVKLNAAQKATSYVAQAANAAAMANTSHFAMTKIG